MVLKDIIENHIPSRYRDCILYSLSKIIENKKHDAHLTGGLYFKSLTIVGSVPNKKISVKYDLQSGSYPRRFIFLIIVALGAVRSTC